jgi:hypothetical protein
VRDLATIAAEMRAIADRAGPLMTEVHEYFPISRDGAALATAKAITSDVAQVASSLERVIDADAGRTVKAARAQIDRLLASVTRKLLLIGAGWALSWWAGSYLAKSLGARRPRSPRFA